MSTDVIEWLRQLTPHDDMCRSCGHENSCHERGCAMARKTIEHVEHIEVERKALQDCNAKMSADMKFLNERLAGLAAEVALRVPVPAKDEIAKAIAYFADAVRESEEIIENCTPALKQELEEQKVYFETVLRVLQIIAGVADADEEVLENA